MMNHGEFNYIVPPQNEHITPKKGGGVGQTNHFPFTIYQGSYGLTKGLPMIHLRHVARTFETFQDQDFYYLDTEQHAELPPVIVSLDGFETNIDES